MMNATSFWSIKSDNISLSLSLSLSLSIYIYIYIYVYINKTNNQRTIKWPSMLPKSQDAYMYVGSYYMRIFLKVGMENDE